MTKAHKIVTAVVMPAGEYWVGDPCYSVPNDRWMEYLDDAGRDDHPHGEPLRFLLGYLDDKPVLGVGTAYGDGEYADEMGRRYPVDAGLIGLTPVDLAEDDSPFGSHLIKFDHDFTCSYSDGTITLGDINIDTNGWADEDDYDY